MSFFKKGKSTQFYTPNFDRQSFETDLRLELKKIIYTEKRGNHVVIRRARRDEEGRPILSTAAKSNRSSEILVKNNYGMRYLFDDYLVLGFISSANAQHEFGIIKNYGDTRTDNRVLYLEHDILSKHTNNLFDMPDEHDKIIIPKFDIEGKIKSPLSIEEQFDVGVVEPYRLMDFGRVEFFKINLLTSPDNNYRL